MKIDQEFYAHLASGELHMQHCNSCGANQMYPRRRCISCYSADLGWQKASGKGKLLTFTVVRAAAPTAFANDLPYALGIVKLEEGPQLLGRLVPDGDGDFGSYQCDQSVAFAPADKDEIARRPVAWFAGA